MFAVSVNAVHKNSISSENHGGKPVAEEHSSGVKRHRCMLIWHFAIYNKLAAMNPAKVVRAKVKRFTDLPNIGPAAAKDFELLGFKEPGELVGANPLHLYEALCVATGSRHDPCVLDTFMSVTHFLDGGAPEPWWHFTEQRKRQYGHLAFVSGKPSLAANNSSKPTPLRGAA